MAQNYQKIGDYISVLDNRNADGSITNLMGISIDKCYIPSVANVIGTDLNNYKVIRKGQFACSLMQVSRDQRIPLAMYTSDEPAIMSPAYVMFEVNRPGELLPEYMELWFKRAEFDREASFYAVGGVRGSLDWEDFCKMKLPVPSISEQRKTVHDYQVITDRIELLRRMNGTLFDVMNVVYSKWFIQFEPFGGSKPSDWTNGKIEDIAEFYDYLRKPLSGEERESMQKLYPYYGAISIVDYVDDYLFDDTYVLLSEDGANILDDKGHPALQFIHGKVWVNNHAHVLKAKNGFSDASLYVFLSNMQMQTIVTGAAQPKINQENLRSFPTVIPARNVIEDFNKVVDPLFLRISENNDEINKLNQLKDLCSNQLVKGA